MNVVDSSAWLEYLGDGANASEFAEAIEARDELVVPSLTLYEVFERTSQIADETAALEVMSAMLEGTVVELSATLSIEAARLSRLTGLAMVEAIILATARAERAVLWTQDSHFVGFENVEYREKAG